MTHTSDSGNNNNSNNNNNNNNNNNKAKGVSASHKIRGLWHLTMILTIKAKLKIMPTMMTAAKRALAAAVVDNEKVFITFYEVIIKL